MSNEKSTALLQYIHNNLQRDTTYILESNGEIVILKLKEIPFSVFCYLEEHDYCLDVNSSVIDVSYNKVIDSVFIFDIQEEVFYEEGIV